MPGLRFVPLPHRAVLSVSGEDRVTFLQGLVSNDVTKANEGRGLYAAFLTPQGKFLHELFITALGEALLIETEAERLEDLKKRLSLYKLRAKVTIEARPDLAVFAAIGANAAQSLELTPEAGAARSFGGGVACVDPRLAEAGLRCLLPDAEALAAAGFEAGAFEDWDGLRLSLGLPDGSRDLIPDKAILLENGFDELAGVDWKKGCYMGQELTARTKYRGLVRKRLLPVTIDGEAPPFGTPLTLDGAEAGEMRSSCGKLGLALVRLEPFTKVQASGSPLQAGAAKLSPYKPGWAVLPDVREDQA